MIYQFVIMGLLASPLALFVLKKLCKKMKSQNLLQNQQVKSCISPTDEDFRSTNNGKSDVIIVGAGVAGSALAYTLGKDGRRVHLIERDLTMPNRMSGEVLQPGGYMKLLELGLEDCLLGIDAQKVFGYILYKDGRYVKLPYPLKNFSSNVAGRSFKNGFFVQRLRDKASSLPNVRLEQGTVLSLLKQNDTVKGVRYKTKTGGEMEAHADLTIICDGFYSNLRRFFCSHKIKVSSQFVGWILENCQSSIADYGHIILAEPSTVLIYKINDTETRCCVDIQGHKAPPISNGEMSHYLKTVVAPQMPPEFYEAFISSIDKVNMKTIPYGAIRTKPEAIAGAFLLGDAFNTRHPFTGGGMTVALSDVVVLRDLLRNLHNGLHDASSVCNHLHPFHTLRRPLAVTMDTLAAVLQEVFCNSSTELSREIKEASFKFLSLGSVCANAPMGLLSGLYPNPSAMLWLFFAMVFYTMGLLILPFPSPRSFNLGLKMTLSATSIFFAILKADGVPRKRDQAIHPIE